MKLRLPWQKDPADSVAQASPAACTHPRVEIEIHGTVVKRRWCAVCGQELPPPERQSAS